MAKNFINHYNGKLYDKESLAAWKLPEGIREQIKFEEYEYFFISSPKAGRKEKSQVHIAIYPSKYNIVFLLEVITDKILPTLLKNVISVLGNYKFDIITSTGFCTHENICHFGIFFSVPDCLEKETILREISTLENVIQAEIYQYSCEGCTTCE